MPENLRTSAGSTAGFASASESAISTLSERVTEHDSGTLSVAWRSSDVTLVSSFVRAEPSTAPATGNEFWIQ